MNYSELSCMVADGTALWKSDTAAEAFAGEETVTIAGFGTFGISDRAARRGRNPGTGEAIGAHAYRAPAFMPARALRETVNRHSPGPHAGHFSIVNRPHSRQGRKAPVQRVLVCPPDARAARPRRQLSVTRP